MALSFPSIAVSQGTSGTTTTRVLSAQFGDGYTQEVADGINCVKEEWAVVWNRINSSDYSTINTFLKARGGWDSFWWTAPGAGSAKLFKCKQWSTATDEGGQSFTINATFTEVFG